MVTFRQASTPELISYPRPPRNFLFLCFSSGHIGMRMQSELNSKSTFDDFITLHWSYGAKSPGWGVASKHRNDFYGSEVTLQRSSDAILRLTRL